VFDPSKIVQITLLRPSGDVVFETPWPSDEKLMERAKARKILGSGTSEAQVEEQLARNRQADLAWLRQLAPAAVEIDEHEAALICEQLLGCEARTPERVAGNIEMTLDSIFGAIEVSVSVPTQVQLAKYQRGILARREVRGVREVTLRLEAGAELYAAIKRTDVILPVTYQVAVCGAVVLYMEALTAASVSFR
jgi:hypothetical protein